jgi:tellurite resistance protein
MELLILIIIIIIVVYAIKNSKSKPKHLDQRKTTKAKPQVIPHPKLEASIPKRGRIKGFQWIPPGESIQIANYEIPDGMIYIGTGYPKNNSWDDADPSFINLNLQVNFKSPDYSGSNMHYWPSYSDIPPESRAAYILWLAGGRKSTDFNIGYVFLFFYGLERHVFVDFKETGGSKDELIKIENELRRLISIYGDLSGSFRNYASRFVDVLKLSTVAASGKKFFDEKPEKFYRQWYDFPLQLKLALGQLAVEGKPIPAHWMLTWAKYHQETKLRTPAQRCEEYFEQLFCVRYEDEFGGGIIIKPNKTKLSVEYHAASRHIGQHKVNVGNLPDITRLSTPLKKIIKLIENCQNDLESYSRWLGRNKDSTISLPALSLLPDEILLKIKNTQVSSFTEFISDQFKNSEMPEIDNQKIIDSWENISPGKLSKSESTAFAQFLEKLGYGIEPDVRFGGPNYKVSGISILFKQSGDIPKIASKLYGAANLIVHLSALVAHADNEFSVDEQEHLLTQINEFKDINSMERQRLIAHLKWLTVAKPSISGLKKKLDLLSSKQKLDLANYLIGTAGADGIIAPDEIKLLSKIYPMLGFESRELYSHLHQLSIESSSSDDLVTVKTGDKEDTGYKIPTYKEPINKVILDKKKIEKKLIETRAIESILGDIFSEDEEEQKTFIVEKSEFSIQGLDHAHSLLLKDLSEKEQWDRLEYEELVRKYNLLPDGALDTLNEKAYEICNDALCEDNDPIEIDMNIIKEMLQ